MLDVSDVSISIQTCGRTVTASGTFMVSFTVGLLALQGHILLFATDL